MPTLATGSSASCGIASEHDAPTLISCVIPAKAGIHKRKDSEVMDPRLRGDDGMGHIVSLKIRLPASRSAEQGFTLIELMVVITIIGVMAAAVILVFPDPRGSLNGEAERFAARALAVRDEAVIGSRETSLIVGTTGYRFERRARGQSLPLTEKPFAPQAWTAGTAAALPRETRVTFDPTGLASAPLSLRLVRDGAQVVVDIATDGTINVGS